MRYHKAVTDSFSISWQVYILGCERPLLPRFHTRAEAMDYAVERYPLLMSTVEMAMDPATHTYAQKHLFALGRVA